jgi:chemotaxis protein histidine kinase CheA/ActR/RegA family two-component response regulator
VATSGEQYELFLTLAVPRIGAARYGFELADPAEREAAVSDALVPLAVDAALLGAEGLRELAMAIVHNSRAPTLAVEEALLELEQATEELGHADASGARVDETRLRHLARALISNGPRPTSPAPVAHPRPAITAPDRAARPHPAPASSPPRADAATEQPTDESDSVWQPTLADDMLAAFLDECGERTDSLSERLLRLEQNAGDRELISEIFRDLHTLKGSSAFAGLTKMNRVAHQAEDLIGALREGRRQVDRGVVDVLLEALDVLRTIVARARAGERLDMDVRGLLARLAEPSLAKAQGPGVGGRGSVGGEVRDEGASTSSVVAASSPAAAAAPAAQSTLRIEFEKVDHLLNLVGEVVLARGRLSTASEVQSTILREVGAVRKRLSLMPGLNGSAATLNDELERLERVLRETFGEVELGLGGLGLAVGQLRDTVMKLRMVPIARLFSKYQRTVRELANKLGKEISVELVGADTELDKVLVERLEDPLLHLVRNAADHGIEPPDERAAAGKARAGRVVLSATQSGGQIVVSIRDDGRGLDAQKLKRKALEKGLLTPDEADALDTEQCYELIFRAGFSTAEHVSDVSGRGVGMDVVREAIARLKGDIRITSELGKGTTLELSLPLTLAITQVLTARAGGELLAIPLDAVVSAQTVQPGDLERVATGTCIRIGSALIQVVDLAEVLGLSGGASLGDEQAAAVVIVRLGQSELALLVQQVLGRHEVVIKALGPLLAAAPCTAGAALIGERMVLVVDLVDVGARALSGKSSQPRVRPRAVSGTRAKILVAEDSPLIRDAIRRELTRAGFEVTVAEDGEQALRLARAGRFDAVSSDVMMPKMDGYELVRALRQEPGYRQVPIVMVTSKDARIDAIKGYDAGADAYLGKPAEADELVRTLDALLRRKH